MNEAPTITSIPVLGQKRLLITKKQKNPRKSKLQGRGKFEIAFDEFVQMNNFDSELAKSIIDNYQQSNNEEYKDSILTYWISTQKMRERVARPLFSIGDARYQRILTGQPKKKPGGKKPNWVILIIQKFLH